MTLRRQDRCPGSGWSTDLSAIDLKEHKVLCASCGRKIGFNLIVPRAEDSTLVFVPIHKPVPPAPRPHYFGILGQGMKTKEAAEAIGVNNNIIYGWLRAGKISEPKRTKGGQAIWTEKDLKRLREHKKYFYRPPPSMRVTRSGSDVVRLGRQNRKREQFRESRLCTVCGTERDKPTLLRCKRCRLRGNRFSNEFRKARILKGLCAVCGLARENNKYRMCETCGAKYRNAQADKRKARILAGLCVRCGLPRGNNKYRCEACKLKHTNEARKSLAKACQSL